MKKLYKLLLLCLIAIATGGNALKAAESITVTINNGTSVTLQDTDGDDYYEISNANELFGFAQIVNSGNYDINAVLTSNINLENREWTTICTTDLYYENTNYSNAVYTGTFNGQGYVISNYVVKGINGTKCSVGLFGTTLGATIKNLGVDNMRFELNGATDVRAAAIVGQMLDGTTIENCHVINSTLTPNNYIVGGVAACNYAGTISNCYTYNVAVSGHSRCGNLVSDTRGDINTSDRIGQVVNCYTNAARVAGTQSGGQINGCGENISDERFASGEIAYLLQGNQQTDIWGQNIDNGETKEALPVLGGAKVYKIYNSGCTHYGEFIYSNDANAEFYHEHSLTEDGLCTLCGGYETAELVDGVYHIGNLGQLMWFAHNVNTAHKVLLTADITIDNSVVWKPIGLQDGASNSSVFNGDGHTITFNNTNEGSVFGLFNSYNYSIIENLYLAGSINCNTTDNVGALVNSAYRTTIRNVISTCDVTNTASSGNVGGLAANFGGKHDGGLYSLIENCAVYADVTGSGNVGGLVGQGWNGTQYWDITNAAYVGNITGANAGAIVGYQATDSNISTFTNIYWYENDGLSFYGKRDTENQSYINTSDKTAEQFASGEVAYLLQGEQETQVWGQNIDNGETKETLPVLGGAKVYCYEFDSNSIYTNNEFELTPHGKCGDNLYWNVTDNILTIFGTGAMYDYEYSGDNISPWRELETAPTSLVLEEGITHIGNSAFDNCSGFNGSLTIPNSVTTIGNNAFAFCSGFTGSLTIPNSVTTIGNYAFAFCSGFTGSLTIPNSVTTIRNWAFASCEGFTGSLTIGNSVTTIGYDAFIYCSGFTGSLTIPNSVTTIGNYAFAFCSGFTGSLTIPNSVTNIGNEAFELCSGFTGSLTIGNSVKSIGDYAFYKCSGFTEVYSFAETAPTLGTDAFANINENATLYHPSLSEHSYEAEGWFNYFSKSIGLDKCGDNLYWNVDDTNTLTIFGTGAMYDYNKDFKKAPWRSLDPAPTSLVLKEGITRIGNYAFYECTRFTGSLTFPNSVTAIGNYAFYFCEGFTGSLTIPNSVTAIGNYAFYECTRFKGSLTIPNSVTAIGNYAFAFCRGFTGSLTIPNSVTAIGDRAFYFCRGFTEIFFYRDTKPTIGLDVFYYINAKVYAPVIWSSFAGIPSEKLVKMATFVGEQSAVSGQQSGWVFPEGMTEVSADDHVAINAPMVISGQQSAVSGQQSANSLSVKSFGLCGNENTTNGSITIEDGAQLYCEVARGEVTVKKEIVGYQQSAVSGQQSESKWYTIASPLKDAIQTTHNSTLLTPNSDYDLYRYDEPTHTWQNAKPGEGSTNFQTIDPGRGYLYANAENTTLKFKGMINTDEVTYSLTTDSDILTGFHLIGNPFTHNITFAHLNATEGAELVNGYYVLNGEGAWGATLGSNEDDVIKVGQSVLVKATAEGTLAISRQLSAVSRQRSGKGQQTTDNGQQSLCISVSNAKYSDRAFVVFDKGVGLDKMNHENENIPLLYIPMEDADYAIAMMDINVNEIPVNFETNVMGEYTISLRQENCEFDELYLLDKETDEKVNILEQDYTFIATSSENPERFILMKDAQGSQLEAHSHFAYINNGDIVIYNIEGDADIKIFDALGRCVYQGESSDETTRIANGYSSGVYMIHKIDDNGVNVQKIIL